jgi:hypothetical protein
MLLSWLVLVIQGSLTVRAAEQTERDDLNAFVRVSPRDSRYFELSNGHRYVPIGLNILAPDRAFGAGETHGLRRMDDWFGKLAANGGNFARVWLSNDFWDVEHEHSGVYDEAKARRIDALLDLARKHGIRLKLTLEHFREMKESPRQSWANKPLHHVSLGGTATNMADFFSGAASRERFKAKLDWFAARYGSDPIIFGWELWNEINAVSGGDYVGWTEVMLPELHRRFPKNLAMQSLGSFDGDYALKAYEHLTRMPGNDVAQTTLIWCRDREDTWQRELEEGQPPQPVKESLDLRACAGGPGWLKARAYDPWQAKWSDLQITSGTCDMPEFYRSLVVVLTQ